MTTKNETSRFSQEYSFIGEVPSRFVSTSKSHPRVHRTNSGTFISRASSGNDTPNYRDIIAKGGNPNNSYSATFREYESYKAPEVIGLEKEDKYHGQSYSYYKRSGISFFNPLSFSHAILPQSTIDAQRQVLAAKFQAKIAGMTADPQTLPFVIESKTLAKDCHKAGKSFLDFLLRVYKLYQGNFSPKNVKRLIRDLQQMWLAWSFTISPTINDTRELAGALAETLSAPARSPRFEVKHSTDAVSPGNRVYVEDMGIAQLYYRDNFYTENTQSIYGALNLEGSTSFGFSGITKNFNLTEWIPTIWELIPYSWAIDYFVNVGQVLDGKVFVKNDFAYLGSNTKKVTRITRNYEVIPSTSDLDVYLITPIPGEMKGKFTSFTRSSWEPYQIPQVSLEIKDLASISSNPVSKILNLMSLIRIR